MFRCSCMNAHVMVRCEAWMLFLCVPSTLIFETSHLTCLELTIQINKLAREPLSLPLQSWYYKGVVPCIFWGGVLGVMCVKIRFLLLHSKGFTESLCSPWSLIPKPSHS